ncbi:unnamed protein product [Brassica oleracea]
MYDLMLDEANQWYQEPPLRKRKLEPSPVEEKEEEAYSSEEDMDPIEREKYRLQAVESCMKKVMVQTKEDDVESSTKLKSSNAIFYMIFKARGGPLCRGIVRKTSDGRTGHMRLEARCWIDKSN